MPHALLFAAVVVATNVVHPNVRRSCTSKFPFSSSFPWRQDPEPYWGRDRRCHGVSRHGCCRRSLSGDPATSVSGGGKKKGEAPDRELVLAG